MDSPTGIKAALADCYRLERELGRGGMATVYLARDLKHERPVALKVLHRELASALGAERFLREIKLAARLQHPHILPLHDSGEAAGLLYYVMPYVEGESLRDRLSREIQLPLDHALKIAREVADALAYAHGQGIIHRDIKPENILLAGYPPREGSAAGGFHALVADFGIARALGAATDERLTGTGLAVGTAAYMSPEQASGERRVDGRSDVYSLGSVLYEMLAGEPPFTGPTPQAILARRLTEAPRPLRVVRESVPVSLERAVTRALARAPADRFATAAELAAALESASSEAGTVPPGQVRSPARAASRFDARRPAMLLAGLLLLLGLGGLFAWRRSRGGETGPPRLAVLPFENLGDSADGYFADGVTDAVRGKLTVLPGLQVIARNSSREYRRTAKTPRQIGRELGADYLLAGTVRWEKKTGGTNRVQVSPELIRVATEAATWQKPFDAEMREVFRVQADIASQVAEALGVALGAVTRERLAERPTASLAAYDAYLRAHEIVATRTVHDPALARQATAQLEQAVALDPDFLDAWLELASVYAFQYSDGPRSPELAESARRAAERTRALAPGRAEGHLALSGYYSYVLEDQSRALAELAAGERIDSGNAPLLNRMGYVEWRLGRIDAAVRHLERAVLLDPRSATNVAALARALLWLRRYPAAVAAAARGLALAPTDLNQRETRAMVSLAQGDLAGAHAVLRAAPREVSPAVLVAYVADWFDLAWVLDDEQQQLLLRLTPRAFDGDRGIWAGVLAQTYAFRGDTVKSRAYADSARRALEAQLREASEEPDLHMLLALALAYLGRHAEALREGEHAIRLGSVSRDFADAPYYQHQLVRIHLLAHDGKRALDRLEPLLRRPYYLSPGWLRIDPTFASLRGEPRFERLTAGAPARPPPR